MQNMSVYVLWDECCLICRILLPQVGTLVELRMRGGEAVYGVVKWRGHIHDRDDEAAGIELVSPPDFWRFDDDDDSISILATN